MAGFKKLCDGLAHLGEGVFEIGEGAVQVGEDAAKGGVVPIVGTAAVVGGAVAVVGGAAAVAGGAVPPGACKVVGGLTTMDQTGTLHGGGVAKVAKGAIKVAKVIPGVAPTVNKMNRPAAAYSTKDKAHAEWSIFEAEVKGPSAEEEVEDSEDRLRAFANAELASASASVGPAKATVGLSANTGFEVGLTQVEAKVLGTGVSIGRKVGVSLFGTGFEFQLW